ncbi:unnamed protein product, partial [Medioppia subpectinata]
MNAMPDRNRQSPDTNSMNETTSSDGSTDRIDNTLPAIPPPLSAGHIQQNNELTIVGPNPVPSTSTAGSEVTWRGTGADSVFNPTPSESLGLDVQCPPFTYTDMVFTKLTILFCVCDSIGDVVLAGYHLFKGNYWYSGLTVAFVLLPTLVMAKILSNIPLVMTIFTGRFLNHEGNRSWGYNTVHPTTWQRYTRNLLTVYRYMDILRQGQLVREQSGSSPRDCNEVVDKKREMARLRVIDTFMESAPQLVLQLYIVAKTSKQFLNYSGVFTFLIWIFKGILMLVAFLTLSLSLFTYDRTLRDLIGLATSDIQQRYDSFILQGFLVKLIWRLFTIAARVLALALFASVFSIHLVVFLIVHYIIMFAWVNYATKDMKYPTMLYTFNGVPCPTVPPFGQREYACLAYVLTFCYHNPVDKRFIPMLGGQRFYYHTMMFVGNYILMHFWYTHCPDTQWYKEYAWYTHYVCFFLGVAIMCRCAVWSPVTSTGRIWPQTGRTIWPTVSTPMKSDMSLKTGDKISMINNILGIKAIILLRESCKFLSRPIPVQDWDGTGKYLTYAYRNGKGQEWIASGQDGTGMEYKGFRLYGAYERGQTDLALDIHRN